MNDIIEGIELFNDAGYFAAHDFFEDLWIDSSKENKFFYQGLVHISVGSFHLVSGNFEGALSQFSKGKTKLERYAPVFMKVDVGILVADIDNLISELKKPEENFSSENCVSMLPKIKTENFNN